MGKQIVLTSNGIYYRVFIMIKERLTNVYGDYS